MAGKTAIVKSKKNPRFAIIQEALERQKNTEELETAENLTYEEIGRMVFGRAMEQFKDNPAKQLGLINQMLTVELKANKRRFESMKTVAV